MVDILAAFEAGTIGGVKPKTVNLLRKSTAHLGRSEGVRESWKDTGRPAFAADFVSAVDRIFEETRTTAHG